MYPRRKQNNGKKTKMETETAGKEYYRAGTDWLKLIEKRI